MYENKKPALTDIPVLLIFFARSEPLKMVFEKIKIARPTKLFLYQDGPRKGRNEDYENIIKCREIVENIDWDCEIYKYYQKENYGCAPSCYLAIKWTFENVDKAIILEDDDVPSLSFFPFCKELLEKYQNDERINLICGMNHVGISENISDDYLFTKSGSIWGLATWKRSVDLWNENMEFLEEKQTLKLLKDLDGKSFDYNWFIHICKVHKKTGRAHYESINGAAQHLHSKLNIVPKKNLISNIGIGANGTHATDDLKKLPRGIRRVFFMKTYEYEFPLKHPKYVIDNVDYKKKVDRIMGNGAPLIKIYRELEGIGYRILSGEFQTLFIGLKRRIKRLLR